MLQAARAFSTQRIRFADPAALEVSSLQQFLTHSSHNTNSPSEQPHAAFTTTMPEEFEEFVDWSKVDLLDACYDPAIGGAGLDR
jgi:glutamate racemase